MQTAVTAKKPGNTAISGHFRVGRTYRGRIKDDHKIDIKAPKLIQINYSSAAMPRGYISGKRVHFAGRVRPGCFYGANIDISRKCDIISI